MALASPLKGLRVAVVGKFSVYHYELKALIEEAGGTIVEYVDRTTSLLAAGEESNTDPLRPKHKTALYIKKSATHEHKVRIVTEEELELVLAPMFRDPQEEAIKTKEFLEENTSYGAW